MCLQAIFTPTTIVGGSSPAMTPLEVPEMMKFCGCVYLSGESFEFSNLIKFVNFSLKRGGMQTGTKLMFIEDRKSRQPSSLHDH